MTHDHATDPEILKTIDRLVEQGSAFDVEALEEIYDDDLCALFVGQDGKVDRVERLQTISEFKARRNAGEQHFSTERDILHIEQQGDTATALLRRRMRPDGDDVLFELRLRRASTGWKVRGETVMPWPRQALMHTGSSAG